MVLLQQLSCWLVQPKMAHLQFLPKYSWKKAFPGTDSRNQVPCGATQAKEIVAKMKDRENKHNISLSLDVACLLQCPGSFLISAHTLIKVFTLSTFKEQEKNIKLVNSVVAQCACIMWDMHVLRSVHVFWSSLDFRLNIFAAWQRNPFMCPLPGPTHPSLSRNMPTAQGKVRFLTIPQH